MKWTEFDDQTQVYMWWEYNSMVPETDQISFQEYDEMMREMWDN